MSGVGRRTRAVAAMAAVALVVSVAVVVALQPGRERPAEVTTPGLAPVLGFAVDSTHPDPERRSAAIRQWVLPGRSLEFAAAYEDYGRELEGLWRDVTVTPSGYRIARSDGGEARILLLSEVRRTTDEGAESTVWELSGYGVIRHADRWWVYAYFGTQQLDGADDPRVDGFTEVPA